MNEVIMFVAVLPENTQNVPRYLVGSRSVISMMTDNENFPAPTPPLSEVSASIDALEEREELARKGGKGMVKERDIALRRAHTNMTLIKACVQGVANAAPDRGEAIILSAGMKVKKTRGRTKQPIEVKRGNGVGQVVLDAKALPKPVQYRWQMSTDQMAWTDLPDSFNTKTTVDGLVPATVYSFRLRTVTKNGPSDWSSPVTIITH